MEKCELEAIEKALAYAKGKHPFFAYFPYRKNGLRLASIRLAACRANLKASEERHDYSGEDVLRCELDEAAVEISKGDLSAAYEETSHAAAVIVRMLEMIRGLQENKKENGK